MCCVCDLASTLYKGDLFVLSWAMMRRVRQGILSSELLMCGGGLRIMYVYDACLFLCML